MKVYKIIHSISKCLPYSKEEVSRYFDSIEKANIVYESLIEHIDCSKDEWISFSEVDIISEDGEFHEIETDLFRYLSDDMKIGVCFNPATH